MKTLYRDDEWYKKKKEDVDVEVVEVVGLLMRRREGWRDKSCDEEKRVVPCNRAVCVCGRGMMLFSERDGFAAKTRESKEMRRRNYSSSSIRAIRRGRGRDGLYGCRCRL